MTAGMTFSDSDKRGGGNIHWVRAGLRVLFGVVFVTASIDKIANPAAFAEVIFNYQILPDAWVNLAAIGLPWLELVIGLAVIAGIWLPGALLWGNLLLAAFIGVLVFNISRGLNIDCGCFHAAAGDADPAEMWWTVIRDAALLSVGLYLSWTASAAEN
ncbi:MAG: MauE/DoxX family redox-associated membrane protein [Desulfobacterales bacterium]